MGFEGPAFRNARLNGHFTSKSLLGKGHATSDRISSTPVISPQGDRQAGQNRDNFFRRTFTLEICLLVFLVGFRTVVITGTGDGDDLPMPRPKRKRLRAAEDRGLPEDEELRKLARSYLETQRQLWPELALSGLLPPTSPEVLNEMIEGYKRRHRSGLTSFKRVAQFIHRKLTLAGTYLRYSCDNSSTLSIIDQLFNCLRKAADEKRFIPWEFVFGDYSVTGLDSGRRGYVSYKNALAEKECKIDTTYIDDFTRASRDSIEWWKLAYLSKKLAKRMIGASDSFDLSSEDWDVKITIYGLLSRLFLKSLSQKVLRGMKGAARRLTCIGRPSFGFTRKTARDEHGRQITNPDGSTKKSLCQDPNTAPILKRIFELFTKERLSLYKIVKIFNLEKVDDWDRWSEATVAGILKNPACIGVFIWNRSSDQWNPEEEKWERIRNPRKDWIVRYDKNLAIVTIKEWSDAQKLLYVASKKATHDCRRSRNQIRATCLLSGTLFCEHCEKELLLYGSHAKYKQMGCVYGKSLIGGCRLTTSKSVTIIEARLLTYLSYELLTEANIERLVTEANRYLVELASKPRIDITPLQRSADRLRANIKKYHSLIEGAEDKESIKSYDDRVRALQKELNVVQASITKARADDAEPPPPLDVARLKSYLPRLKEMLNKAVPEAAEAIRAITGPISVTQELIGAGDGALASKRARYRWIAKFTPNLGRFLWHAAQRENCPDSVTLEILCSRIWTTLPSTQIEIGEIPKFVLRLAEIQELSKVASVPVIASKLQISRHCVDLALQYAATGKAEWPNASKTKASTKKPAAAGQGKKKYPELAGDVLRLRDVDDPPSFREIGRLLNCDEGVARRAYDYGQQFRVFS
jgi:DNA invertase Pin-like site-specific DNA recombinase